MIGWNLIVKDRPSNEGTDPKTKSWAFQTRRQKQTPKDRSSAPWLFVELVQLEYQSSEAQKRS